MWVLCSSSLHMAVKRVIPADQRLKFEHAALPHLDAVYTAALRLARNPDDAEDLLQETILRAYRFFHQFTEGTNCRAWLLAILYNNFRNAYRRGVREQPAATNEEFDREIEARSMEAGSDADKSRRFDSGTPGGSPDRSRVGDNTGRISRGSAAGGCARTQLPGSGRCTGGSFGDNQIAGIAWAGVDAHGAARLRSGACKNGLLTPACSGNTARQGTLSLSGRLTRPGELASGCQRISEQTPVK